jgi:hypothetical protein
MREEAAWDPQAREKKDESREKLRVVQCLSTWSESEEPLERFRTLVWHGGGAEESTIETGVDCWCWLVLVGVWVVEKGTRSERGLKV